MEEDTAYKQFLSALKFVIDEKGYGGMTAIAIDADVSQGFISQILKPNSKKKAGFKTQASLAKACGYKHEDLLALGQKLLSEKETPDSQKRGSTANLTKEVPRKDVKVGNKMEAEALKELLQHYKVVVEANTAELNALREEIGYLRTRNRELEEAGPKKETPSKPEKKTAV